MWAVAMCAWLCQRVDTKYCCDQCKSGWIQLDGWNFKVEDYGGQEFLCRATLGLYCDPNKWPAGRYGNPSDCNTDLPCNSCSPGQYKQRECDSTADTGCTACAAGTSYSTSVNAAGCTACSTCPAGQIKTAPCTATRDAVCRAAVGTCCEQCNDGYLYNGGAYQAIGNCWSVHCFTGACNSGSYIDPVACATCPWCPPGSYCVNSLSMPCPAGTSAPSYGQSSCTSCTAGIDYAAGPGSTGCTPCTVCQPGSRVSREPTASSDRQCIPCSGTWTSTTTNARECDVCKAGTYKGLIGSSAQCFTCSCSGETYINCPEGSIKTTCTPCTGSLTAGYCAIGREPSLVCTGRETQDTSCRGCPAGKEKLSASVRDCSYCPTGKYKIGENTNACVDCTNKNGLTYAAAAYYTAWTAGSTPSSNSCPW